MNIQLHKEAERRSKREMETEGTSDREENSKDGEARMRERERQIFRLALLKQQRKDPSYSWLPNFNLQMSFCLLSGDWSCR